jgi:hypothetical protein
MVGILNQNATVFADAPATHSIAEAFNVYATLFVYLAIAYPLLGGAVLWLGFQAAKIPDFTFFKCWKIYLAGLCYGYLAIIGLGLILKPAPAVPTVLFFVVPLIAIPLLGRNLARRVVVVEVIAIVLANSAMVALLFTVPFVIGPQRTSEAGTTIIQQPPPDIHALPPRDRRPRDIPSRDRLP